MKKRNPQDATLRNIRALKKRVTELEKLTRGLVRALFHLQTGAVRSGRAISR